MSSRVVYAPERDKVSFRRCPPAHYVAEIHSVRDLLNLREHTFGPFKVGGYKWRLELQPRGHKTQEKEYMSLYLVLDKPKEIENGERILVDYKFFVFNNNDKTYGIFKESGNELGAFSRVITRRGLQKFLSLESFENPANGYRFHDPRQKYRGRESCIIGAELLVSKPTREKETLTIIPSPIQITQKIQRFSTSQSSSQYSEKFKLGENDWKLKVRKRGESLSVELEAQSISEGKHLFVKAKLLAVNKEHPVSGCLNANNKTFGATSFMPWSNLKQLKGGLPVTVKILTISEVGKTGERV